MKSFLVPGSSCSSHLIYFLGVWKNYSPKYALAKSACPIFPTGSIQFYRLTLTAKSPSSVKPPAVLCIGRAFPGTIRVANASVLG